MTVHWQTQGARAQAQLEEEPFHRWTLPDGTVWTSFHRCGVGYLLRFPHLADFAVSLDGASVTAWPAPGTSTDTVEHLYLNQILPLALSRQGRLVLHASAVEVGDAGVAFIGESGRGKSTLAASFATSGSRFLTDDGLQLHWLDGSCLITPSHASVRLWEDSQEALIHHSATQSLPVDYTAKVRLLAGDQIAFCAEIRPLQRVYFLGDGSASTLAIKTMAPPEALMALVKNSFLLDIDEQQLLAWHFEEMVRLSALPIFFHLDYPRRYEDLPQIRDAIIEHVTHQKTLRYGSFRQSNYSATSNGAPSGRRTGDS